MLGHILTLFLLVSFAVNVAAIQGERALLLELPGSYIATQTPGIVAILYVVGVTLDRGNHRAARWVQLLVAVAMLYPMIVYWMFSHTMVTAGTISSTEIQRFKKEFSVPAVFESTAGSFQVTVASKTYTPRMGDWLHRIAATPPQQRH